MTTTDVILFAIIAVISTFVLIGLMESSFYFRARAKDQYLFKIDEKAYDEIFGKKLPHYTYIDNIDIPQSKQDEKLAMARWGDPSGFSDLRIHAINYFLQKDGFDCAVIRDSSHTVCVFSVSNSVEQLKAATEWWGNRGYEKHNVA